MSSCTSESLQGPTPEEPAIVRQLVNQYRAGQTLVLPKQSSEIIEKVGELRARHGLTRQIQSFPLPNTPNCQHLSGIEKNGFHFEDEDVGKQSQEGTADANLTPGQDLRKSRFQDAEKASDNDRTTNLLKSIEHPDCIDQQLRHWAMASGKFRDLDHVNSHLHLLVQMGYICRVSENKWVLNSSHASKKKSHSMQKFQHKGSYVITRSAAVNFRIHSEAVASVRRTHGADATIKVDSNQVIQGLLHNSGGLISE